MRRALSVAIAIAMLAPALATIAEAVVGTWLAPREGQLITGGKVEVSIGFNTQSDEKVTHLELYADGRFYARRILARAVPQGVCSFRWDASRASQGTHYLAVKVFAGDKFLVKVSGTATVGGPGGGAFDARPPVVRFTDIKSGDVLKGLARIRLEASDDSGKPPLVSFLVDNSLKMLRNMPPYAYDLDTTTYANGGHELESYAYDAAGNRSDPAVVKVAFQNEEQRPVVAALSVDTKPVTVTEDDGAVVSVPANVTVTPVPAVRPSGAARTQSAITGMASAPPTSTVVEPKPRATATKPASAPKRSSPARVVVSANTSKMRPDRPAGRSANAALAAEPPIVPDVVAVTSEPKVMVMAESSVVGSSTKAASSRNTCASAPKVTGIRDVVLTRPVSGLRSADAASAVCPGRVSAPELSDEGAASVCKPENVKVAMVVGLRASEGRARAKAAIASPPPVPSSRKARIEEATIPASGKLKIRDVFDKLGGVLFWDPISHAVTAYLGSMCLELQIGSATARVNGRQMRLTSAPYIVRGRTIIDAQTYHQACALAAEMVSVASAKAQ